MASFLAPVSPPVGVNAFYVQEKGCELVLKEKALALSGDDFTITDRSGRTVMRCKGRAASLHAKKYASVISSAEGQQLFRIEHQLGFSQLSYLAYDGNNNVVFSVAKGRNPVKQIVRFRNFSTQSDVAVSIVKDSDHEARVVLGDTGAGQSIAHIVRDSGGIGNIMCAQNYFVTIAPGVDASLLAALTVCYDHTRPAPTSGAVAVS